MGDVASRVAPWKAVVVGSVALGALAAIFTLGRRESSPPPIRSVALIGDSYAVGLGPELEKLLPSNFQFDGRIGSTTAQWARQKSLELLHDWLSTFKPDVVLVSLGVNDGTTPNLSNYQAIVRALHGGGARVVWIEPPAAVNAPSVRTAISSLGVQTVPATTAPLSSDGLHPKSYAPWAGEIARALR